MPSFNAIDVFILRFFIISQLDDKKNLHQLSFSTDKKQARKEYKIILNRSMQISRFKNKFLLALIRSMFISQSFYTADLVFIHTLVNVI